MTRTRKRKPRTLCVVCESQPHLDDAVHVWDEAVDADFQQHDQSPAHILPHFTVLITGQCKQTLDSEERSEKGRIGRVNRSNFQTHGSTSPLLHSIHKGSKIKNIFSIGRNYVLTDKTHNFNRRVFNIPSLIEAKM